MEKSKEEEMLELAMEAGQIIKNAVVHIQQTEKDPSKVTQQVNQFMQTDIPFNKNQARIRALQHQIDRINILECASPDLSPLWRRGLKMQNEYFEYLQDIQRQDEAWEQESRQDRNWEPWHEGCLRRYIGKERPSELANDSLQERGKELFEERVKSAVLNYYEMTPPFVRRDVKIPAKLKDLYAESRWCYVLQLYRASVVLCRSIIEYSLKYKAGIDVDSSIGSIEKYLDSSFYNMRNISKEAHQIGHEVRKLANKVMHAGKDIQKTKALEAIDRTKDFLEDLFGMPKS
jgi:hypothetical protein